MEKKGRIKLIAIMVSCTAFIFSFSHFGVLAYDSIMHKEAVFTEGTMIGTVDVSDKPSYDAVRLVDEQLTSWLNGTTIQLQYKEKQADLHVASFQFDIQQSVTNAQDGMKNRVEAALDSEINTILTAAFPGMNIADVDTDKLQQELLAIAAFQQTGHYTFNLAEYTIAGTDYKSEMINQVVINLENSSFKGDIVANLGQLTMGAKADFSLLEQIGGTVGNTVDTLNVIASAIYELVLPTNFSIRERYISNELPAYVKLGYEAKVSNAQKMDLIIFNPNDSDYHIILEYKNTSLVATLKGVSFNNKYKIVEKEKETFKPKTIVQFNSQLNPLQKVVKTAGKQGVSIQIIREVYDDKGKLLKTEEISKDFYSPIHRVEVHGLISDLHADSQQNESNPDSNNSQQTENANAANKDGETQLPNSETTEQAQIQDTDNALWGKPNEQSK